MINPWRIWKKLVAKEKFDIRFNSDIFSAKREPTGGVTLSLWRGAYVTRESCDFMVWTPDMSDLLLDSGSLSWLQTLLKDDCSCSVDCRLVRMTLIAHWLYPVTICNFKSLRKIQLLFLDLGFSWSPNLSDPSPLPSIKGYKLPP